MTSVAMDWSLVDNTVLTSGLLGSASSHHGALAAGNWPAGAASSSRRPPVGNARWPAAGRWWQPGAGAARPATGGFPDLIPESVDRRVSPTVTQVDDRSCGRRRRSGSMVFR